MHCGGVTLSRRKCDALPAGLKRVSGGAMQAGPPDPDFAPPPPSLVQRLAALRAGAPRGGSGDRRVGIAVAALIAAGPLLTIAGAAALGARERVAAARLSAELAPRLEAEAAAGRVRARLGAVLAQPSISATIEAVARVLPAGAALVRAERTAQGALELEIAAPDPDALRAALRRAPELAGIRTVAQREGDGALVATMRLEAR
jgi:hypothetical protein